MCEMRQETDYAVHHVQKVLAFFVAMRRFADQLTQQGHQITYYRLDDPLNRQDLIQNIEQLIESGPYEALAINSPTNTDLTCSSRNCAPDNRSPSNRKTPNTF